MLLSSQFQRYCRDLHTEAVDHIAAAVAPVAIQHVVRSRLLEGRKLDHGNPNKGNLGSDFGRLGFDFWNSVRARDAKNGERSDLLDQLAGWRNAIAHHDFTPITGTLQPPAPLRLETVKRWRSSCGALAKQIDAVVGAQVAALVGNAPW